MAKEGHFTRGTLTTSIAVIRRLSTCLIDRPSHLF